MGVEGLAAGHPVVVLQNLRLGRAARWHHAVAVGYDLRRHEVVLRSGRNTGSKKGPLNERAETPIRGGERDQIGEEENLAARPGPR